MHRFYLAPGQCLGSALTLRGAEARHAHHVLRLARGERVVVLDGNGREHLCEVAGLAPHTVSLLVRQTNLLPKPPWRLTLIQAVTKAKSMELIVQKATELGACRIVPILSARSVPQLPEETAARKVEKWRAIAVAALKQCGSPWLPQIETPQTPAAYLARHEAFELTLLASLQPGSRHPRDYFLAYAAEHHQRPASVAVWVGPEGDFTPAELHAIKSAGALPITLGPLVLRSETAALYCLSVLSYELQGAH
jgi:16S rRNA (uracil1498-N3)-methyltransferase